MIMARIPAGNVVLEEEIEENYEPTEEGTASGIQEQIWLLIPYVGTLNGSLQINNSGSIKFKCLY